MAIHGRFVYTTPFRWCAPTGNVLYCLTLEYARHGDLSAFLSRGGKGWSEAGARREIAGILEVLSKLHRGQALHRDLTPLNVFVCDGRRLKLGDFGIVRQQSDRRGITAHTMNALTAPSDILARATPRWQARDDVYQVGQLLGMLIKGDAGTRLRPFEIRRLSCTDHLKEIVYRCIGERRKRYENAHEMIDALSHPPAALKAGVLRSLKGVHLRLHRNPQQAPQRGDQGRAASRRDHPQRPVGKDQRRRPRTAQPAAGGRVATAVSSSWRSSGCARRVSASRC
jgi:serine/threonine-protein kinase